jgi:lysyl-tRNA synthetase class 2
MSENDLRQQRLQKLERLRDADIPPYPDRFERTHRPGAASLLEEGVGVRVGGRIVSPLRRFGKLTFAHIGDVEGRIQVALTQDGLGREAYKFWGKVLDIGDFVGIEGELFRTRTGEITIRAATVTFLGKAIRPLPDKWAGINDRELCYRQRYLDLIANEETRRRFGLRTRFVRSIRQFLDDSEFVEVETPILINKPSGALARPFRTSHHALGIDVYLSIAPETYLKRLIVGGFDRVYEFARCFRNEGIDPSHLQDFTMLEFYAAYWNYEDNIAFTRRLFQHVIEEVLGTLEVTIGEETIDFSGEWPRRTIAEAIAEHAGIEIDDHPDAASLRQAAIGLGLDAGEIEGLGRGALIDQIYKKTARPKMIQPTFLVGHPIELSPLARRNDDDPTRTDRFQLLVRGWEIVNAYSELVDPLDQRDRLEEQARLRAAGDDEAMLLDEEYLLAMEHGMPPISGWGMGIDRFVALLTGQENLRDVVFFPLMRPTETKTESESESELESVPGTPR